MAKHDSGKTQLLSRAFPVFHLHHHWPNLSEKAVSLQEARTESEEKRALKHLRISFSMV